MKLNFFLLLCFAFGASLYGQPQFFDQTYGQNGILNLNNPNCKLRPFYSKPALVEAYIPNFVTVGASRKMFLAHENVSPGNVDVVVFRLNGLGLPDLAFGINGKARISLPGVQGAHTLHFSAATGFTLVAGVVQNPSGGGSQIFISKLRFNGRPDTTFGTNGTRFYAISEPDLIVESIAKSANGTESIGILLKSEQKKKVMYILSSSGQLASNLGQNGFLELNSNFDCFFMPAYGSDFQTYEALVGGENENGKTKGVFFGIDQTTGNQSIKLTSPLFIPNIKIMGRYEIPQPHIWKGCWGIRNRNDSVDLLVFPPENIITDSATNSASLVIQNLKQRLLGITGFSGSLFTNFSGLGEAVLMQQMLTGDSTATATILDKAGKTNRDVLENGLMVLNNGNQYLKYAPLVFSDKASSLVVGENQNGAIVIAKIRSRQKTFEGDDNWKKLRIAERRNLFHFSPYNSQYSFLPYLSADSGTVYQWATNTQDGKDAIILSRHQLPTSCAMGPVVTICVQDTTSARCSIGFGTKCGFAYWGGNRRFGPTDIQPFFKPFRLDNDPFTLQKGGEGVELGFYFLFLLTSNGVYKISQPNGFHKKLNVPANKLPRAMARDSIGFTFVGENGSVYAINLVDSLVAKPSPVNTRLNAVTCQPSVNGLESRPVVIVGDSGVVLIGRSMGENLVRKQVPTRQNLNAVTSTGRVIIAVGDSGVVLKSFDRGQSWNRDYLGTTVRMNDVIAGMQVFVGNSSYEFMIAADSGLLFKTTNGAGIISEIEALRLRNSIAWLPFPNPNNGNFQVDIPESGFLTMYNVNGQETYRQEVAKGLQQINCGLKNGLYFLKFSGVNQQLNSRLVLKTESD